MCQIKTVLIAAVLLLAAAFCMNQVNLEKKKVGHNNHLKSESPWEKAYKKYCLNGGECYYLVDEDTVGCYCT